MREYRPGQTIDGRWQVQRVLQGGLGRVYIVIDLRDCIPLALKTFQVELADPETMARFRQEAYAWIQVGTHPNLVRAYSYLPYNDEDYLFLEYVDGGDLSGRIGTCWLADRKRLLRLALQFCDGMIHAQRHGLVVHRDIKPQNCMLTADGDLKITDFGLAKSVSARPETLSAPAPKSTQPLAPGLTGQGEMLGTVAYMAPEQFNDAASVDVRADIYSFGIMLFEMLTGRLPFWADNLLALAVLHHTQPPPRLTEPALDSVIQACLAKDPGVRPADFSQLRQLLAEVHAHLLKSPAPAPARAADFDVLEVDRRAVSLMALGYQEQAVELLEQCLRIRPDLRCLWAHMGHALNQLGNPQQALACLERAQAMEATASNSVEMGLALELLGQPRQAEACYQRALQLDDGYASGYYTLGCLQAGEGRLRESLENFRQAIELSPDVGGFRVGMAMALVQAGQIEMAAETYQECLQRDSNHVAAWSGLGLCLHQLGDLEQAEKCLRRAVILDSDGPDPWLTLGQFLLTQKRRDEALQCFLQAEARAPDHPTACEMAGRLYLQLGNQGEGLNRLQRAHDLGSPSAGQLLATLRRGQI